MRSRDEQVAFSLFGHKVTIIETLYSLVESPTGDPHCSVVTPVMLGRSQTRFNLGPCCDCLSPLGTVASSGTSHVTHVM